MSEYILSIDVGTQSTRAMIFDEKGSLLVKCAESYPAYFSEQEGFAEQYPQFYWEKFCETTLRMRRENPTFMEQVSAVTVTTMRDTVINLDKRLEPIRPAILWLDRRIADKPNFPFLSRLMFGAVGMTDAAESSYRATKSNWLIQHEPETWEKTHKFIFLSAYINYKLTGVLSDSIANQIGHIPFDYKKLGWMNRSHYKWCIFNVDKGKFPELVNPTEVIGEICACASEQTGIRKGLPLIASGPDKNCETLGNGCIDEKTASVSYGTTSTVQLTLDRHVEPELFMPPYPSVIPGKYNPEQMIYRGYWMVSWFKEQFGADERQKAKISGLTPEQHMDELMKKVPAGSDGLILQPYWSPGLKKPEARGSVIGFRDTHTRAHFYRALIEGICYELRQSTEQLERQASAKVEMLGVSGGGAKSDIICQITADVFKKPVYRVQTYETSGLGSAMAGFVGMGIYKDFYEAKEAMSHITSVFEPDMEAGEIYERIYTEVYREIYPRLRGAYKKLRDIYPG